MKQKEDFFGTLLWGAGIFILLSPFSIHCFLIAIGFIWLSFYVGC